MAHDLRFQVLILPNVSWSELLNRFLYVEELGFDLVGTGDHFVDWSNPPSPWFEMWTVLAAVAARTTKIRLGPSVAQIPLRNPAMFARQALTVDHVSNGRLEMGLGLGLTIDPSYDIMGIPNWSNKERVKRFTEYVEIVDQLLSNEVTSYKGDYYEVKDAVINPRPLQTPRPPITIAAMGPVMLKKTARYADTWNSLSFAHTFEEQLEETRGRIAAIDEHCSAIGRDPGSLRRSYLMFDAEARPKGGFIKYYESEEIFADMVRRITALGISEIGLYYPMLEEQLPMFETIARDVIPKLKVECGTQQ
ncbi:LLM class flavin-dependent oxidoreductase [Gammaproteobacteria bacterium]|nr:LLM class flavin-dependent oxidoreductase [Gammaproteobacteria bacterium]